MCKHDINMTTQIRQSDKTYSRSKKFLMVEIDRHNDLHDTMRRLKSKCRCSVEKRGCDPRVVLRKTFALSSTLIKSNQQAFDSSIDVNVKTAPSMIPSLEVSRWLPRAITMTKRRANL